MRLPPGILPAGTLAQIKRSRTPTAQATPPPLALPPTAVYTPKERAIVEAPAPVLPLDSGIAEGYETFTKEWLCTDLPIVNAAGNAPMTVYRTKKRWQAVDVYATTNFAPAGDPTNGFLTFGVYAIARGMRSLISTGRLRGGTLGVGAIRVCGARVVADSFEVVVQRTNVVPADPAGMRVTVSVIASDRADSIDPDDYADFGGPTTPGEAGVIVLGASGLPNILTTATPKAITPNQGQIPITPVAIMAVNTSAALRYIQLADGAGGTTLASWSVPIGSTIWVTDSRILRRFRQQAGISVRQSSTPIVNTASADVNFN
ncbi:MAG: hypothetical protein EBS48_11035, partial [Actinobacteria bacterium]|nr:hypothetical protein [Actinomycetota bacterium]